MSYGKQEIYDLLNAKGIQYEAIEHEAVYTMEGMAALGLPHEEFVAKHLFLRDAKKKNFYIFVVATDQRVDLKSLGERFNIKGVGFASEKYLESILGVFAGAVSPFGALNDTEGKVRVYVDDRFKGNVIAVHPNDNTASVYLQTEDLVAVLADHGTQVEYFTF